MIRALPAVIGQRSSSRMPSSAARELEKAESCPRHGTNKDGTTIKMDGSKGIVRIESR